MKTIACLLALGLATTALGQADACTPSHAQYEMVGHPNFSAGFKVIKKDPEWHGNLTFYVKSKESSRTFWFLFDQGSARYINLISTTDVSKPGWSPPPPDGGVRPLGEMHYFQTDKAFTFSGSMPGETVSAPEYIFLPDLEDKMWYKAEPREHVPTAFFKLKSCRQ